jgi:hypothetical protein
MPVPKMQRYPHRGYKSVMTVPAEIQNQATPTRHDPPESTTIHRPGTDDSIGD